MSQLAALGAAVAPPPPLPAAAPVRPTAPSLQSGRSAVEPVSLSDLGIALSKRSEQAGARTIDYAQRLLGDVAHQLFGHATLQFDSASIDTSSSLGALLQSDGQQEAGGFSLQDHTHFIGKGQIVTSDGQRYDFEIEVDYQSELSAAGSRGGPAPASPDAQLAPPPKAPPVKDLQQPIQFGGTLNDLFALLGKQLHTHTDQGDISARLLKLLEPANV